jgi:hypothetical protein
MSKYVKYTSQPIRYDYWKLLPPLGTEIAIENAPLPCDMAF